MSTLNTVTKQDLIDLSKWVHEGLEGCDGDFLKLAATIEALIAGHKDLHSFKLQERQAQHEIKQTIEVVADKLFVSECPFHMGYDYWADMGVAAMVWNTVIATPDDIVTCVAHHLKHREGGGVMEDKFWSWAVKYVRDPEKINFFVHIAGDDDAVIKQSLERIAKRFVSTKNGDYAQSSYNCNHYFVCAS